MAQPSNTFSTYDAVGNREDLSDIIYDISPTETPFLSAIPQSKATGTKHEWQKDALASPSGTNFKIEGDDATTGSSSPTGRIYNYTAISDKVARVTGTQEGVSKAGRRSEMAYQMEKRMKELKKDVETILLQNNAWVAGDDNTARESGGAMAYIKTNTSIAGNAVASAGNGSDQHTNGTARAFTETMLEAVLASAWTNGGSPTMGIVNAFQKRKAASFTGSQTSNRDAKDKKIVNSVDIYIDPLGNEIRFVPCRQAPVDAAMFFDPEYVKFAVLRDFHTTPLAKTGDSERKQILVEYTLEMGNEAAHAGVYDLTTS